MRPWLDTYYGLTIMFLTSVTKSKQNKQEWWLRGAQYGLLKPL